MKHYEEQNSSFSGKKLARKHGFSQQFFPDGDPEPRCFWRPHAAVLHPGSVIRDVQGVVVVGKVIGAVKILSRRTEEKFNRNNSKIIKESRVLVCLYSPV